MDIEKEIKQLISTFDKVKSVYQENEKIINDLQGAQWDYMHKVEKTTITDVETVYLDVVDLKKNLQARRKAKDENMLLEDLYNYVKQNDKAYKEFSRLLTTYYAKKRGLDNRQYEPKSLKNLNLPLAKDDEKDENVDFTKILNKYKRKYKINKKYGRKAY